MMSETRPSSPNGQPGSTSGHNRFFDEENVPEGRPVTSLEDVPPHGKREIFTDAIMIQDVEDRKADRALRERFGEKAYKVVRKTLYGWAWLLGIYAFFKIFGIEVFPIPVMIAITTAVTLNVFAAFLGVIRGLFPAQKQSKD